MSELSRIHVYVAGPMTIGDPMVNVRKGIDVASALWDLGFVPFCPHLSTQWQLCHPHTWDQWLEYDERWLERCDCLFRIPGESRGVEREVKFCKTDHIPVFDTLDELLRWAQEEIGHSPDPEKVLAYEKFFGSL